MSKKKALFVGINKYSSAPLRGCVNDCLLMYRILSSRFGFDRKGMKLLTDKEATKNGILDGLKWLVQGVEAGDTLYFHYSGHGSQVVVDDWTNSDEADGRDEILCPINLDWKYPIRDHHMGDILRRVPKGVKIVVVLDCCHSGTGLRNSWGPPVTTEAENDWCNRFMPPPPSNVLQNPLIEIDKDLNFQLPELDEALVQTQKKGFIVDTVKQGDAILISGCQDNQTSADAFIGGKYHGALSYTMAQTLLKHNCKISYQELIKIVNQLMDKHRFEQNPQLESKKAYFLKNFLN